MTREQIVAMAREAELHCHVKFTEHGLFLEDLEYFANLVATAERKACARLCDGWTHADGDACAEAIRARGERSE